MQNPYSPWPLTWIPVEESTLVEHHLLIPLWKRIFGQPDFKKNVLINFNCSSKHNLISENSDHPPEYVTPWNWNGNTHGWFGFGLSEVVWHVDAVVGTGGLVVAGGLVEAGELEGSG